MSAPENPPAFPSTENHPSYDWPGSHRGLTLRDYFAGQAIMGDFAQGMWDDRATVEDFDVRAELFYRMADAMLLARAKTA